MDRTPGLKPHPDEVLALDLLCLVEPSGSPLDATAHRERLAISILKSEWAVLRRGGRLIAYGYLWQQAAGEWFVGGLAIHPDHRTAPVVLALGAAMRDLVERLDVRTLRSHVLRSNAASLRLHRRLGFAVEQENERAIAFCGDSADLFTRLPV